MSLLVQHREEFTIVRRDNDGWLLGTVHHSRRLDGFSVIVLWPLGVRDGHLYQTEADGVAAIGRHQFTLVRTVLRLRNNRTYGWRTARVPSSVAPRHRIHPKALPQPT